MLFRHFFKQIAQFACRTCPVPDLQQRQSALAALLCSQPIHKIIGDNRQIKIQLDRLARSLNRHHPIKGFRIGGRHIQIKNCLQGIACLHKTAIGPKPGARAQHIRGVFIFCKGTKKAGGDFILPGTPGCQPACPIAHKSAVSAFGNRLTGGTQRLVIHPENEIGMGNLAAQMPLFRSGQISQISRLIQNFNRPGRIAAANGTANIPGDFCGCAR